MSAARQIVLALCVLFLAALACRKPEAASEKVAPTSELVELRVVAPGMAPVEVELQVLQPLEAALNTTPGLRHMTTEAGEGQARLELELDPGSGDAARSKVLEIVVEARSSLPEGVEAPVLLPAKGRAWTSLRWSLTSQELDLSTVSALNDELVQHSYEVPGVASVQTCAPRRRILIELDLDLLLRVGLDAGQVETALRSALQDVPVLRKTTADIDTLRSMVVAKREERAISLAELAAIRYGFGDFECVSISGEGMASSAVVILDDAAARGRLDRALDKFTDTLPPSVKMQRFGPEDTSASLSFAPGLGVQEIAESIGGGLGAETQPWLLEVGVDGELCHGSGTQARLSMRGGGRVDEGSLRSLQSIPGVTHVELVGTSPMRSLWLLGPELELLRELGERHEERLRRVPGLSSLALHLDTPRPTLEVVYERERLAALGLSQVEVAKQVRGVLGDIELTELIDHEGRAVPVILRVGERREGGAGPGAVALDEVGSVLVRGGEQPVRLDMIAEIRGALTPGRICRYDGRRGVLLELQAADEREWPKLEPAVEAELPPGYSWAWTSR